MKVRSETPIFEKGNFIFVTLADLMDRKYEMEIFKDYKYIGHISVRGHLKGMDDKGRMYFVEEEDTKVVRYTINMEGKTLF